MKPESISNTQSDPRSAQLKQALAAAKIGDWEIDLASHITRHSLQHDQCFGYNEPIPDWTYQKFLDHVHPGDRERVDSTFQHAIKHEAASGFECRVLWPDESQHWIRVSVLHQRDAQRDTARLLGTIVNITELRQAEETARETERQFRVLADSIPNLAWMADSEGWIFWYNQRWYDYTGTTLEEMAGWGWQSVHDPAVLPQVLERIRKSFQSGELFEMVFPLRGYDGVFRPFLTRMIPVLDGDGKVLRWFGTNTDISAQKQAELALDLSIRRFERLAEANPFGVTISDLHGKIHSVNPAFSRLLGYSEEEVLAGLVDSHTITPPEYWGVAAKRIEETVRTGEAGPFEKEYITKDGRRVPVLVGSAMLDSTPGAERIVAFITDLTTLKRAEEALRKSDALAVMGRLAASIAHEINNPLAAVTNLLYLVRYSSNLGEAQTYAARAEKELSRVSQIVTQTLRFYRQSTQAANYDPAELIDSVLDLYRSRLADARVHVQRKFVPASSVWGYSGEIRQVLANLIGNALDAMPQGGTLSLRVRPGKQRRAASANASGLGGVRITISDSGVGMSEAVRKKIFEPFFTTKGARGTGLGLWVSAEIVQKHQGSLKVRSNQGPQRRGTTFSLFLPERETENTPEPQSARAASAGARKA